VARILFLKFILRVAAIYGLLSIYFVVCVGRAGRGRRREDNPLFFQVYRFRSSAILCNGVLAFTPRNNTNNKFELKSKRDISAVLWVYYAGN
jgi:hypothetical protein